MILLKKLGILLKCEIIKNISVKNAILKFFILIMVLIGYSMIIETIPESKEIGYMNTLLETHKKTERVALEELEITSDEKERASLNTAIRISREAQIKLKYCIENNINPNGSNIIGYLEKIKNLNIIIIFSFLVELFGVFEVEDKYNTWRLMNRKQQRYRVIFAKLLFSLIYLFMMISILYILGIIIGITRFGFNFNNLYLIDVVDGVVLKTSIFKKIIVNTLYLFSSSLFYYSVIIMIKTYIKGFFPLIIGIILTIFSENINNFLLRFSIEKYFPFKYIKNLGENFQIHGIWISILVVSMYIIVMWAIIFKKFSETTVRN